MRINDQYRIPATQAAEKTDQATESRPLEQNSIANNADQTLVSDLAKALMATDPGRLEQLRLEVQSGKYDPSADAVAKSIISAHMKE
jgi:anti-sigma28 factor (negative regulator of flagellin synthesis)